MLTLPEYAARHDKSTRTVQRWLDKGALPGAQLVDGRWRIPADVLPMTSPAPAGSVVVSRAPDTSPPPTTLAGALDTHPAFLDLGTAATLLGISVHAVRENIDRFQGERLGRSWYVPAAVVRQVAGL